MKYKTRKDKRKPVTGAKAVDSSCKNNGTCSYCISNRMIKNKKRLDTSEDILKSYKDEN